MKQPDDNGAHLAAQENAQRVESAILTAYYNAFNVDNDLDSLPPEEQEVQKNRLNKKDIKQLWVQEIQNNGAYHTTFTFETTGDISSDLIGTFTVGNHTFTAIFPLRGTPYYKSVDNETGVVNETADITKFDNMVKNSITNIKSKKNRGLLSRIFRR